MLKQINRKSEGFTIIEVLIVLAIAGLIMLIVFLAVPALQRTSRNTQRTNAISQILSSINNYTTNNGGTLPTTQATLTTAVPNAVADYKPGYYTTAHIYYGTGTPPSTVSAAGSESATSLTTEDVLFYSGYTCSSKIAAPTTTNASSRGFALEYAIEKSGGTGTLQCQSS